MQRKRRTAQNRNKEKRTLPTWTAAIAFATLFTAIALSFAALTQGKGGSPFAFCFYFVAVISFVYCIVISVQAIDSFGKKVSNATDRYAFTRNIKSDYDFRTLVFFLVSFVCNLGFAIVLCVMAFRVGTLWYGALAAYYLLLTFSRGFIMIEKRKLERRFRGNYARYRQGSLKTYGACGVMLITLTIVLLVAVVEMAFEGERLYSADAVFFVFAAFGAYRIYAAIQNFIKGESKDVCIRAMDTLNFVAALVTLLCMFTALLDAIATPFMASILNGGVGVLVCASVFAVGAYMIRYSKKEEKEKIDFSENP